LERSLSLSYIVAHGRPKGAAFRLFATLADAIILQWTAVDRPELRHFTNVIVLSVKGPRRAADYLSGGDYDGDKGLVIWEPQLVEPFVNAPLHFSEEPPELASYFEPKNETVGEFLERTADSPSQRLRGMQQYLLSDVRDVGIVGQYSNWQLNATYSLGYRHPETIRLDYMSVARTLIAPGLKISPIGLAKHSMARKRACPFAKPFIRMTEPRTINDHLRYTLPSHVSLRGSDTSVFSGKRQLRRRKMKII
jgi:hypothetical protein